MAQQRAGSAGGTHLTPTHRRILEVLADGEPHPLLDLKACLDDDLADSKAAVAAHLTAMRKVLRRRGEDIICEWVGKKSAGGNCFYRHVKLLRPDGTPLVTTS